MSGFIKPLRNFSRKKEPFGGELNPAVRAPMDLKSTFRPDINTPAIPAAPTVDDAQQSRQEYDRLRRRKGVLANIFAGNSLSAPSVGKATLG